MAGWLDCLDGLGNAVGLAGGACSYFVEAGVTLSRRAPDVGFLVLIGGRATGPSW
jgi:hypothetical protein